jgi:hypothetical protein
MIWLVIRLSRKLALLKKPGFLFLYPVFFFAVYSFVLFLMLIQDPTGGIASIFCLPLMFGSLAALSVAIPLAIFRRKFLDRYLPQYCLAALVLIPLSTPAAIWMSDLLALRCNEFNIHTGNRLVNAIAAYHSAENAYPFRLSDLVPVYIEPGSLTTCYSLFKGLVSEPVPEWNGFAYKNCYPGVTQINIPHMGYSYGNYFIYDFSLNEWSISDYHDFEKEERRVLECNPIFIEPKRVDY